MQYISQLGSNVSKKETNMDVSVSNQDNDDDSDENLFNSDVEL